MQYFSYGARGAIDGTETLGPVRQRGRDVDFPISDFVLSQAAGKPNGYAALDPSGNVTSPVAGDVSAATVKASGASRARALSALLGDVRSVADFGVVGDGATDDTIAMQAALAAAGRLYVPPSMTCLVGTLSVSSNTCLTIDGTLTLKASTNSNLLSLSGVGNVVVDGIGTLDGNKANNGSGTANRAGISVASCTDVTILGVKIQNCVNWPINVTASTNVVLGRVRAANSGNSVEFAAGSSNCWASEMEISGIGDEGFAFYGGVFQCGLFASTVTGSAASGVSVLNDSAQAAPCKDIVIEGNVIHGNALSGIEVNSGTGGAGAHSGVAIVGNRVFGNDTSGQGIPAGIYLGQVSGGLVSSNSCSRNGSAGSATSGISLASGASYVNVVGNVICDEGVGGTNGVGVTLSGAAHVAVVGNLIYDDQPTKTMAYGINGTAGAGVRVALNTILGTIGPTSNLAAAPDTIVVQPESSAAFSALSAASLAVSGVTTLGSDLEIGSLTAAQAAYADFHSSGSSNDYDVRLVSTGGTAGTSGKGTLSVDAASVIVNAPLTAADGVLRPAAAGLAAAGTTQGTALALAAELNEVTTVASGAGVILSASVGLKQTVFNRGANALLVYPPSGASLDGGAANAPASLAAGARGTWVSVSAAAAYSA